MRSNGPISNARPRIAWQTLHAPLGPSFVVQGLTLCCTTALNWTRESWSWIFGERRFNFQTCFSHHFFACPVGWDTHSGDLKKLKGSTRSFVFVARLWRFWCILCIFCYWESSYLILPVHLETHRRSFFCPLITKRDRSHFVTLLLCCSTCAACQSLWSVQVLRFPTREVACNLHRFNGDFHSNRLDHEWQNDHAVSWYIHVYRYTDYTWISYLVSEVAATSRPYFRWKWVITLFMPVGGG